MRSIRFGKSLALLVVLALGIVLAPPASAGEENADGLTFRQMAFSVLTNGAMSGPVQAIVSPEGDDVYVSGYNSETVVHFARNNDGSVELLSSIASNQGGLAGPPYGLAISPNGRFVYASVNDPSSFGGIVRYDRDDATGVLSFGASLPSNGDVLPGLHNPAFVAASPDSRHLYVLCDQHFQSPFYGPAIATVSTDPDTGAMALVQSIDRTTAGPGGFGTFADVTVSPDGLHVYVAAYSLGTIEIYTRNATTGELTFSDIAHSRGGTIPFVGSVAISPDGLHGYATDVTNGAVALLDRDPDSGGLTYRDGARFALEGANRIAISPEGDRVCITSQAGFSNPVTSINAYARDPDTGLLTHLETLTDGISGVFVLQIPGLATFSGDNENYYLPTFGLSGLFNQFTGGLAVFSLDRPDLPCEHFPTITDEYEAFAAAYNLYDDIDLDGLPELASLALLEEASCANMDDAFDEAITNAYLINLTTAGTEFEIRNSGELAPYQHAIASLNLIREAMNVYLNEALDSFGFDFEDSYLAVSCTGGACEPANARAADEPFSGEGDPDEDGFTNAEEWANVLARGGSFEDFARSALDPTNDGTRGTGGGGGGGGCLIATAAYGTPLAAELGSLRDFRDTRMLTNPVGAAVADVYYRLSPPVAEFIAEHPRVCALARTLLAPIVKFTASE